MISKFIINRTRWNVMFNSKDVFSVFKDDIISDAIEMEVTMEWKMNDKC